MRVAPWVCVVGLSLAAGCTTFGKKSGVPATPTAGAAAPAPASTAGGPPRDNPLQPAALSGILAGQVIDSYDRRPPQTFIQVNEPGSGAAPIEVAADGQGYFTIQGLQPGHHYQLTARARNGDRVLAGTTWATPPDPKLLIRVSEDYATPATPPVPGAPAVPGAATTPPIATPAAPTPPPPTPPTPSDQGWSPTAGIQAPPQPRRSAEIDRPEGVPATAPPMSTVPPRPQDIADQRAVAANPSPPCVTPGQGWVPPAPDPQTALPQSRPPQAPFCALTGQTLYDFALQDLQGQEWQYRRDHRGRLVLLDFWGTWCGACCQAIPHLRIWQQRFGPAGLEVVGIAYEQGTPEEKSRKVRRVADRLQINYRLLLGGETARCPVRGQFGVAAFPTVILLDEGGRIIWRSTGLEAPQVAELDAILRQRLGAH